MPLHFCSFDLDSQPCRDSKYPAVSILCYLYDMSTLCVHACVGAFAHVCPWVKGRGRCCVYFLIDLPCFLIQDQGSLMQLNWLTSSLMLGLPAPACTQDPETELKPLSWAFTNEAISQPREIDCLPLCLSVSETINPLFLGLRIK